MQAENGLAPGPWSRTCPSLLDQGTADTLGEVPLRGMKGVQNSLILTFVDLR